MDARTLGGIDRDGRIREANAYRMDPYPPKG
jgi:hypothetical protein